MRIGLTGIFVDDQDQAEKFSTEALGLQVKTNAPYSATERWLSVVSRKTPTGSSWCCTWPTSRRGPSSGPAASSVGR
jgi:catechol 2,3-dioxygenase-like lactoylglutathione lyase family enzyme